MATKRQELPRRAVLNTLFEYHEDGRLTWRYDRGVNGIKKGDPVGQTQRDGYTTVRIAGRGHYRLHRIIWKMHYDTEPEIIDHINRDRLDNRIENLRPADRAQNRRNTARTTTNSPYKGVYPKGGRWQARITINGKTRYFGSYETAEEAARVIDEKARALDPEYSTFNFPDETPGPTGPGADTPED